MRTAIACALGILLAGAPALAQGPALKTEDDKTLYALGLLVSRSLANFNLSEAELANVLAGIGDGVRKKEQKVDLQTYGPKVQALHAARVAAASEGEKKAGEAYLVKAAGEKGATKTPSGLVMTTVKPGPAPRRRPPIPSRCTITAPSPTGPSSTARWSARSPRPSRSIASSRAGRKACRR